jgi:hypothetical protein
MEGISKVAAVGGLDNTTAASASIMVGRRGEWGTGYALDILPDPEAQKRELDALRTSKKVVPPSVIATALVEESEITQDDIFSQSAVAPPPSSLRRPPTASVEFLSAPPRPLPPAVPQLVRPAPIVSAALLNASTSVAVAPSLPQGVDALVVVTKQARRVLPRLIPPKIALVASDTSGSTSVAWDVGLPAPDFVPLKAIVTGSTVRPITLNPLPLPPPRPATTRAGLPTPIDAAAWVKFVTL